MRSALTRMVILAVGTVLNGHSNLPAVHSGQLRFLGSIADLSWWAKKVRSVQIDINASDRSRSSGGTDVPK